MITMKVKRIFENNNTVSQIMDELEKIHFHFCMEYQNESETSTIQSWRYKEWEVLFRYNWNSIELLATNQIK